MPEITKSHALDLGRAALHQEMLTLLKLEQELGDAFWQCARLLIDCPGLVWITAVGTSASVAMRFAHILTCSGTRAMFLSPSDGLHGHTNIMRPGDILVAMSRGGESQEVLQMVSIANQLGVMTLGFVHDLKSSLARNAQFSLPIQSPQEYELMGFLATTSTVAYSAVCDALCSLVAQVKGFNPEQFTKVHPGGAVGQVLTSPDENRDENRKE
jgi:D-arabinose 5-phosphate isomerase GutQ